jgi:hypothetical protein
VRFKRPTFFITLNVAYGPTLTMMMMLQTTRVVPSLTRPLRLRRYTAHLQAKRLPGLEGYPLNGPGATPLQCAVASAPICIKATAPSAHHSAKIASYWGDSFQVFDDLSPVVSTHSCFDLYALRQTTWSDPSRIPTI